MFFYLTNIFVNFISHTIYEYSNCIGVYGYANISVGSEDDLLLAAYTQATISVAIDASEAKFQVIQHLTKRTKDGTFWI